MIWTILTEEFLKSALLEDLGGVGDVTTDSIVPVEAQATGVIAAREPGTMAGGFLLERIFRLLDPDFEVTLKVPDGARFEKGTVLATLSGSARALLTGERTALNLVARLCGIASTTAKVVDRLADCKAQVVCTRKTTPGLRLLEKYAVKCGGGSSHRFGLDDGILIKDNHIAIAGSAAEAVKRAKTAAGHMLKIEVEVDTLKQLESVLEMGVDAVLLDNMSCEQLRQAVAMVNGRLTTEASGGVTLETVREIGETGVDLVSMGSLTHASRSLDLGLDMQVQTGVLV